MSDKEKLDKACILLAIAIRKNVESNSETIRRKWAQMALRGSVQTRLKKRYQNFGFQVFIGAVTKYRP